MTTVMLSGPPASLARWISCATAVRGSWLALRRLVKCQPFHPGGFDYVPPATSRVKPGRKGYGEKVSAGQVGPPKRGSS